MTSGRSPGPEDPGGTVRPLGERPTEQTVTVSLSLARGYGVDGTGRRALRPRPSPG